MPKNYENDYSYTNEDYTEESWYRDAVECYRNTTEED